MNHPRPWWLDVVGVGVAALLTGLCIGFLLVDKQTTTITSVEVQRHRVVSPACGHAINQADKIVTANVHLTKVTNKMAPLVADAYAAGLDGRGPNPVINRVARLNVAMRKAQRQASFIPPRYGDLSAKCLAADTNP